MEIKKKLEGLLLGVMRDLRVDGGNEGLEGEIKLEHPAEESHGDYSSNIALTMFSKLQETNSKMQIPLELAEAIVEYLKQNEELKDYVEKVEVAKPGFINFWLSKDALARELSQVLVQGEQYGSSDQGKGKTILVDHSHPNIAKRFGIGHLRSTIIGQAILNLYRFTGWNTIADNFLGDWGTQFGMIIAQIKRKNLNVSNLSIDDIEKLYVEFNQELKEDLSLQDLARSWFKKLEDGDEDARLIWAQVKKVSMEEFEKIWELLGVRFDHIHGESFFEDKMPAVIDDAKKKGVAVHDQGALVVRIPGHESPLLLLKSDGATTYETRDLAAIQFWKEEFNPDVIAYEVGSEQALHFQQLFAVSEMLGYMPKDRLVHIQHGLYLGTDGKKMRTRSGDTIKLEEVLNEAVERAKKLGAEDVAEAVGIGAVKYFDLSHHHASDIIFDWEKMFVLEGNSAPYLQYTHARCRSLLQRAGISNFKFQISNLNGEELSVLRHLYKFPEVVESAATNFTPNTVCAYLFELAQRYNTFYNRHRILDTEQREFRLALTSATGNILKTGLHLLGIKAPSKM